MNTPVSARPVAAAARRPPHRSTLPTSSDVDRAALSALPALLALLLTACAPADEQGGAETSTDTAGEGAASPDLVLIEATRHLGGLTREPMLVEHPSGALFVAGYGSQSAENSHPRQVPVLWTSTDGGATWSRVDVGTPEQGAIGNSDVDLAIGPEGTLYFASMGYDRSTGRGTHVALGASRDVGASWSWSLVSETDLDDRPWVAVTPDAVAHVVWNDGDGVAYARSTDRGDTWSEQPRIHEAGGSSHLAAGPSGELAVRIGPLSGSGNVHHEGTDLIAVSLDGGDTWTRHDAPGDATWPSSLQELGSMPRWVEPLAWDGDGNLHHLWGQDGALILASSTDRGATWTRRTVVEHEAGVFFPYLVSDGGHRLAATWFEGGPEPSGHAALLDLSPGTAGATRFSGPLAIDAFAESTADDGTVTRRRDTGGEYFPAAFLADGRLAVVTTIQLPGEPSGFSWWTSLPPAGAPAP